MGREEKSKYLYLLDFGLAKKYRSSSTLKHYPMIKKKNLTGTARYASINALRGYEHSRRDDLEAAGYVLIYFIKGRLPWQGIQVKTKEERYKKILKKKIEISPEELCENLPQEFEKYIDYTRNLEYLEEPDYAKLKELFNSILKKDHAKFDYIYDWTTAEEKLMRRAITPKSELESNQNKKTTFASFKHFGDSREENNDKSFHFTLENNISKKNIDSKFNNSKMENKKEENDIKKNSRNKIIEDDEEPIFLSKKNNHIDTISNDEEVVCCTSGCNIF